MRVLALAAMERGLGRSQWGVSESLVVHEGSVRGASTAEVECPSWVASLALVTSPALMPLGLGSLSSGVGAWC